LALQPLVRAAKGLDAPAIRLLVAHGANLTLTGARGITPIMAAAGMGSVDADTRGFFTSEDTAQRSRDSIEALVKAGADVNSTAPMDRLRCMPRRSGDGIWRCSTWWITRQSGCPDKQGKSVVDSAMGRNGGNSRGSSRIDVHQDTADLLIKLGAPAGVPALPPVTR